MDVLQGDLWAYIAIRLPFYDFVWLQKVCRKWRSYFTETLWLQRLSFEFNIKITTELRELFRLQQCDKLAYRYLHVLSHGRRIEKSSKDILNPLDCLGFAMIARNVPLVEYFTKLTVKKANITSDEINRIEDLCSFLNEPDCLLACLKLLPKIEMGDNEIFCYNIAIYSKFSEITRDEIFQELRRLKIIDQVNISACELYLKYGFAAYKMLPEDAIFNFIGSGTVEEIEKVTMVRYDTIFIRYRLIAHLFSWKGIIVSQIEDESNNNIVDRGQRKFMLRRGNLWSCFDNLIPLQAITIFPEIYQSNIPRVLHICHPCKHYCFDPDHKCSHQKYESVLPAIAIMNNNQFQS